jgi:hypothetical protein
VDRVDVHSDPENVRARGIRRYPTLVHGEQALSGLFLTRRRIRRFLNRL